MDSKLLSCGLRKHSSLLQVNQIHLLSFNTRTALYIVKCLSSGPWTHYPSRSFSFLIPAPLRSQEYAGPRHCRSDPPPERRKPQEARSGSDDIRTGYRDSNPGLLLPNRPTPELHANRLKVDFTFAPLQGHWHISTTCDLYTSPHLSAPRSRYSVPLIIISFSNLTGARRLVHFPLHPDALPPS